MRDRDVRAALLAELESEFGQDPNSLILDEVGVCRGAVRIDVAVINCALHGFEIKSEQDTLDRLPRQRDFYGRVFETVTLVTGERHLEPVLSEIPSWWGIKIAALDDAGNVELTPHRNPGRNTGVDPGALVQFLWRDEALAELETRGLDHGVRSKPRKALWSKLATNLPYSELSACVRERLRYRENWRSDLQPS